MKKKLYVLFMCAALICAMLAGCSSQSDEASNEETSSEVTEKTVYVSPEWVNAAINGEVEGYEDVVVAEVDYPFVEEATRYNEGHIPGAIYISDMEVEDAVGTAEEPYNLLSADEIEKYLLSHGITANTKVILYGDDISGVARVAFGYIYEGVKDVKVMNGGGIDAWTAAGYETETTLNEGTPATDFGVQVPANPQYWVSMDDAKDRLQNDDAFKLVSIRSEEEWLGTTSGYSYMDKAGEPEGAVWGYDVALNPYDMSGMLHEDGTTFTYQEMVEKWADADFKTDGSDYLAFYCGTGWRACVPFLVFYEAGVDNVGVYDGGWYEWMLHDDNPVQVGDPSSDDCEHTTVGNLETGKAAQ